MRCRNCHTVMMETDPECPVCHASAASATAAAPGPMGDNKPGLGLLLPMFGGAIGGAIYGAIKVAEASSRPGQSTWGVAPTPQAPARVSSGANPLKWLFGIVFLLAGGLFLMVAVVNFFDTWKIAQRVPKVVTAGELAKVDVAKSVPGSWLAYTFVESKPLDHTVMRKRLGKAGEVKADCLLVRVQDRWLLATVAQGFDGDELVGRLVPLDSPLPKQLADKISKVDPKAAGLLAFEFNGVDGSASDLQQRYIAVGVLAFFGLLGLLLGVRLWAANANRRLPSPRGMWDHRSCR